ncbi:MAG: indole-3-glycerol phosphate synthase TrpC [Synergistaceae bacterium]|nr:indole-3-glycerol phosphate synthase TrpC [Synergistaceae bacterium]
MTNILNVIADSARIRTAEKKQTLSLPEMREISFSMCCNTGFPFEEALAGDDIGFICECKKASPSKGVISHKFPYLQIAQEYEKAGADCISVLTEPEWFLGSDEHLREIAASVSVPCLRKDFIVDEYMIYEAKTLGASAVLLICSLLDATTVRYFIEVCDSLGLSALVETHNEQEISKALKAGARLIGVNNRDLRNFTVDFRNSQRLRALVPQGILFAAESGIEKQEDINILREARVDAVLIGEAMMRAADKKSMLRDLRGGR